MKKSIAILLTFAVFVSCTLVACSSKEDGGKQTSGDSTAATDAGLMNADTEFGTEVDEDGNEVDVEYATDKKGNTVAYAIDPKTGQRKKTKSGKEVTVKISGSSSSNTTKKSDNNQTTAKSKDITTKHSENNDNSNNNDNVTPQEPDDSASPTDSKLTTIAAKEDKVPSTSDSGKRVAFSEKDMLNIAAMLEVPGLYKFSYENKDGVSADMAVHVAIWMAQREGISSSTYPSGTIVLDLFKYFGQTVVNFKTNCNTAAKSEKITDKISYNATDSVFKISGSEKKEQSVKISRIEYLGNNNYYKVTGEVSGVKPKKVVAIMQKNKLDNTLGFSVKALKWS